MRTRVIILLTVFLSMFYSQQIYAQTIEDSAVKSYRLSENDLNTLFHGFITSNIEKITNYHDFIDWLNKNWHATWYFGHKDLTTIPFELKGKTAQSKIINAFKAQLFETYKIHGVLCLIDPGLYFTAQSKFHLAIIRAKICNTDKIYNWCKSQLVNADVSKEFQTDYDNFFGTLARQASYNELKNLAFVFKDNSVIQKRKVYADVAQYLYPDPDFAKIATKLSKHQELKRDFEILSEIASLKLDNKTLDNLSKSTIPQKAEAAKILKAYNKILETKSGVFTDKLWWALLLRYQGKFSELKTVIEANSPKTLDEDTLGNSLTAWLLTRKALSTNNTAEADYFLKYLKYFNFSNGTGDLIAQALPKYPDKLSFLLPSIAKYKILEAGEYLLSFAQFGNTEALDTLMQLELSPKQVKRLIQLCRDNKGNSVFSQHTTTIVYDCYCYEAIDDLLEIYETGSNDEKIAVLKTFSRVVTLKTLRCLIVALNSNEEDLKTSASNALREIFPDKFLEFKNSFIRWREFYTSFASLPNYKEID